jgi:hypothetical protein
MKWLRLGLEVIGAAAILGVVVLAALVARDHSDRANNASRRDALFILNWAGLPTDQDYRVVSSYRSARSLTGDHLDYFCIQLPRFEVAEQTKPQWQEGPETNPLLADALELAVNDARDHGACVPSAKEANAAGMELMFVTVVLNDRQATAADIILYDARRKMLYYVSYKT